LKGSTQISPALSSAKQSNLLDQPQLEPEKEQPMEQQVQPS
jgi:hypothetical protein